VTIRHADEKDVPALLTMAQSFVSQTKYHGLIALSLTHLETLTRNVLAAPEGQVWIAHKGETPIGMLAMGLFEHPMSGERVASEVVWWVEPDHRGSSCGRRLLRAAEDWAKAQRAALLQMVAPDARVGRFYEALGYVSVETAYQKRLG
jgi:GNAT superfamily N-acetyltransferase